MKKAKIFLSTIALLSVIGGALAFKAQNKFNGGFRCTTMPSATCTITYSTVAIGTDFRYCTLTTAPASAPCNFYTRVILEP